MITARTPADLILKLAKREGVARSDFTSFIALQRYLMPRYTFATDHRRDLFTATPKPLDKP